MTDEYDEGSDITEIEKSLYPPIEYQIVQPYTTVDGNIIGVMHPSYIEIESPESEVANRLCVAVYMPKDPVMPISGSNPVVLNFVPGHSYHVFAKNSVLLRSAGLNSDPFRTFESNTRGLPQSQFEAKFQAFLDLLINYRYCEGSDSAILFKQLLSNQYPYFTMQRRYKMGGTALIIYDQYNPNDRSGLIPDCVLSIKNADDNFVDDKSFTLYMMSGLIDFLESKRFELGIEDSFQVYQPRIQLNGINVL